MKQCTRCGAPKELTEFRRNKRSKDGRQHYCRDCASKTIQFDYEEKYASIARKRTLNRSKKHREIVRSVKQFGCCLCLEDDLCCLDLHHLDPAQKDFTISTNYMLSMERLLKEVDKCIVLCKNCHTKVHAGLISLIPAKGV